MSDVNTNDIQTPEEESNTKWYVLRVVSGKERKIKEYLEKEVKINEWEKTVLQILCPVEKVLKVQKGKKVIKEKILFPGYLMVEAIADQFNDVMIQGLSNVTNVIHFLGREHPTPLRKSEVNKMFGNMDAAGEQELVLIDPFILGESVRITDGPFNDFTGEIEEINDEKKKLKVIVKIFGRDTPVELSFTQVEKVL